MTTLEELALELRRALGNARMKSLELNAADAAADGAREALMTADRDVAKARRALLNHIEAPAMVEPVAV